MNNSICFIINGNELYLDKNLVSFNDIPIFFVCKDSNGEYYLALCSNIDEFNYLVFEIEFGVLYKMLKQQISMRDALTTSHLIWNVQSGFDVSEDVVIKTSLNDIDKDVLPLKDALYEPVTDQDLQYVQDIENNFLSHLAFTDKIEENIELNSSVDDVISVNIQVDNEMRCLFTNTITLSSQNEKIQYKSKSDVQFNSIDGKELFAFCKNLTTTIYLAA